MIVLIILSVIAVLLGVVYYLPLVVDFVHETTHSALPTIKKWILAHKIFSCSFGILAGVSISYMAIMYFVIHLNDPDEWPVMMVDMAILLLAISMALISIALLGILSTIIYRLGDEKHLGVKRMAHRAINSALEEDDSHE